MTDYPVHKGGPHWVLSDETKVQGSREDAEAAEAALHEEPTTDAVTSDDVAPTDETDDEVQDEPVAKDTVAEYAAETEGVAEDSDTIIIRMTTSNVKRGIGGYTWTRNNPFEMVGKEDADYILAMDGFERATPAQVASYYA